MLAEREEFNELIRCLDNAKKYSFKSYMEYRKTIKIMKQKGMCITMLVKYIKFLNYIDLFYFYLNDTNIVKIKDVMSYHKMCLPFNRDNCIVKYDIVQYEKNIYDSIMRIMDINKQECKFEFIMELDGTLSTCKYHSKKEKELFNKANNSCVQAMVDLFKYYYKQSLKSTL